MGISPKQLAAALGGDVRGENVLAPGPGHSPNDRSLSVKIDPTAPGGFVTHSFADDDPLECKDHVRKVAGLPEWEPRRRLQTEDKISRSNKAVAVQSSVARHTSATSYFYRQADGTPFLRVYRTASKHFWQAHWDGASWQKGAPKGPKLPYRLPELLEARHEPVLIVEGEKDADALSAMGLTATTNAGGAGNWAGELNQYFKGRDVFILPDNDEAGEGHAQKVAAGLDGVARQIRIVRLPNLPPKGDVSDWIDAGGTLEELRSIMGSTPPIAPQTRFLVSSSEFIAGFVPPDYVVDHVLQRRFVYSLTAPTGSGKTALALLFAACVALGRSIGDHQVESGRVLYFAGENPDDVRMRWLAMAEAMSFDIDQIDVHFVPGVFKLSEISARIASEVEKVGPFSFVIVDTSAAFFEGNEENDNVQMGLHARRMRELINLPGGPCVVVACHPIKNASQDSLLPRGGGAFVAEVDGNLTASKSDSLVTLHWQGKFRGPDFAPITFRLLPTTADKLRDSRGRSIPTVIAKAMSERERGEVEANTRDEDEALLDAIDRHEGASMAKLAEVLQWLNKKGQPDKSRVQRSSDRLKKRCYLQSKRGALELSSKGRAEVKRLRGPTL